MSAVAALVAAIRGCGINNSVWHEARVTMLIVTMCVVMKHGNKLIDFTSLKLVS